MAEIKRLDLGNPNPIHKREINLPRCTPEEGEVKCVCLSPGRGAEDVGIRKRRVTSRLSETRGVRKVSAECDRDVDGRLMLPVVLRPSPGESISAWFGFPCRQST